MNLLKIRNGYYGKRSCTKPITQLESTAYDAPLLIHKLLSQTLYRQSPNEIVYGSTRETWQELNDRAMRLAFWLKSSGIGRGSKVAVVDYDTSDYLEAYYGVPAVGAVLHTVNIRLPPEQIAETMAHAEDKVILVRDEFAPMCAKLSPHLKSLEKIVVLSDSGTIPGSASSGSLLYGDILKDSERYEPEDFDENTPATLFYTSGTTGRPKGVSFTHRQLVLHTLSTVTALSSSASPVKLGATDTILPLVPMFHVHGWGFPYAAGLLGLKYVLVGKYDPGKILEKLSAEKATFSHMVPTVLTLVLNHPSVENHREALANWKVIIGGAALPTELARKAMRFGIRVMAGYGLSETAPILTLAVPAESEYNLPPSEMLEKSLLKTGLPAPLVDIRVVDKDMKDVPRDGRTIGEIVVRAPWTTREYYKDAALTEELWAGGWLHTRDLATIDRKGYLKIADRAKDAVKSGGEWISTIELEDILIRHLAVLEAAVIGAKHEEWGERPVAIVTKKPGTTLTEPELKDHMMLFVEEGRIAKYWVPDAFIILSEPLPKTSTGKIDKKPLREKYSSMLIAKTV
jgi:fatty-acyl-CoA synthase